MMKIDYVFLSKLQPVAQFSIATDISPKMRFLVYWFLTILNFVGCAASFIGGVYACTTVVSVSAMDPKEDRRDDISKRLMVSFSVVSLLCGLVLLKNSVDFLIVLGGRGKQFSCIFQNYRQIVKNEYAIFNSFK